MGDEYLMKKKLLAAFLGLSMLIPATLAFADEPNDRTWWMPSNTQIEGELHLSGGNKNIGQAKTTNLSDNGIGVKVKIYATVDGSTIPGSTNSASSNGKDYAYTKATARSAQYWGNGHTTTASQDEWKWCYLSTED